MIIDAYRFGAPLPPGDWTTFDPSHKTTQATLSNANLTVSRIATPVGYGNTRTVHPITGKRYFSCLVSGTSGTGAGFTSTDMDSDAYWIGDAGSGALWRIGTGVYLNSVLIFSVNPTAAQEFAVDDATRSVWIRSSGSAWIGGGDPALGTSPTFVIPGSGDIFFAVSLEEGNIAGVTLHSDPADVTGVAPSGFTPGLPG